MPLSLADATPWPSLGWSIGLRTFVQLVQKVKASAGSVVLCREV